MADDIAPIADPDESAPPVGLYHAGVCLGGGARFLAVDALAPALEIKRRHELAGNASVLAAESLVAALLMSAHVKGDERLTLQVFGEEPEFSFICDVNGDGTVRGRFSPQRMLPQRDFKGSIAVMKSLFRKELYRSILDVRGETIEASLDRYLRTSQQVDARVAVLAERDKKGNLIFAGGLLVERLPHMDAEAFAEAVDAEGGWDLKALLLGLAGIPGGDARIAGDLEILGGLELRFACTCGPERVRAILRATGHDELQAILQEQGQASVNCHFCNSDYVVPGEELAAMLLDMAQQRPGGEA